MPSVFESITSLMSQGDTMSKLGSLLGSDNDQTASLVGMAAPALLGGVADKAAEPGGLDAVTGMLDGLDGSTVDNPGAFFDRGDASVGSGMLDGIFGDNKMSLISALMNQSGAKESTITRLLPMLAPVVMGALNRRRQSDNLDGAGMMSLLANEKAGLADKGLFDFGWLGKVGAGAGAAAGPAALAKGAAGGIGSKVTGAAGSITSEARDVASNGVGSVVDGGRAATSRVTGAAGDATKVMAGGVDTAARGVSGVGKSVGGAAGGAIDTVSGTTGGRGPKWLLWALGGLLGVLALAWALSQCGGTDVDAGGVIDGATEAVEEAGDAAADAAGDAADAAGDAADAAGDAVEDAADTAADMVDGIDIDALQADVDGALGAAGAAGVSAVVGDDGVVTLTGTVDSEEAKAAAEAAAMGVEGVTSVVNNITVEAPAEEAEEEPVTINDELSLDPITFEVSSANITAEGQAVLDQAAEYLTANADVNVEIAGHTDADGDEAANMALSQARAESVKAYLEGKGIDGARMTPQGYGETQPIASNDTAEGKAQNRRIEFIIQ